MTEAWRPEGPVSSFSALQTRRNQLRVTGLSKFVRRRIIETRRISKSHGRFPLQIRGSQGRTNFYRSVPRAHSACERTGVGSLNLESPMKTCLNLLCAVAFSATLGGLGDA